MSLDARKPVGNGLLLRFLECKRVVKRTGEEVGERAEEENFLIRESAFLGRFNVQNAH